MPKVSVITTFLNGAPFLGQAVRSVLAQTFGDFEHILVNDGSTDGWQAVLDAVADPRQVVHSFPERVGRVKALNHALSMATGEYVAILDADDTTGPERLAKQVAYLDGHPDTVLVGTHCRYLNGRGEEIGLFTPPADAVGVREAMASYNPVMHSSVMYRREAAADGYPADYPYAHDFAFYLGLLEQGAIVNLPEILVDVVIHEGQMRVDPELAVARLHDELRCFTRAGAQAGLSRQARGRGGRARMYVGLKYACALRLAGERSKGFRALWNQFQQSPRLFVRAFWVNRDLRKDIFGSCS